MLMASRVAVHDSAEVGLTQVQNKTHGCRIRRESGGASGKGVRGRQM